MDNSHANNPNSIVKSLVIDLNNGSTVENPVYAMATQAFPTDVFPNVSSNQNITIPNGATVNLSAYLAGSTAKKITVGDNATLTINKSELNLTDGLELKKNAKVKFIGCTKVNILKDLKTDDNARINTEGMNVVFNVFSDVTFNKGAIVKAIIYAPDGTIETKNASSSSPNLMTGKYMAKKVTGGDYTTWNETTVCPCGTPLITMNRSAAQDPKLAFINAKDAKMEVVAYPNPSEYYFNLRVKSTSSETVYIRIFDMAGKKVKEMKGTPDELYKFGDNLTNGMYIAEVKQGMETIRVKVIKQ